MGLGNKDPWKALSLMEYDCTARKIGRWMQGAAAVRWFGTHVLFAATISVLGKSSQAQQRGNICRILHINIIQCQGSRLVHVIMFR